MKFLYQIFDKFTAKIFTKNTIFLVTMVYFKGRKHVIYGTTLNFLYLKFRFNLFKYSKLASKI